MIWMVGFRHWLCAPGMPRVSTSPNGRGAVVCRICAGGASAMALLHGSGHCSVCDVLHSRDTQDAGLLRTAQKGDQRRSSNQALHFLCSAFNTGAVAAGLFCKVIVMLCPSSNCCEVLSSVLCSAFLAEIVTAVLTFITWLWISNLSLASFAGVFKMRQAPSTATAVQQYRSVFLNLSEYTSTYINIECKN